MRHLVKSLALLVLAFSSRPAAAETGTAAVTLTVPVGATLTINGQPTHQMTGTRYFVTPELTVGGTYRYLFVATFTWNGEEVTRRKQLDVAPGGTYKVDMFAAEPVKKPVEEPKPVVKPDPPKPVEPKPAPKVEPKKVEPPKPAPKVEIPAPSVEPKPKPQPKPVEPVKPKEPVAQPERQVAPKPREVKAKK